MADVVDIVHLPIATRTWLNFVRFKFWFLRTLLLRVPDIHIVPPHLFPSSSVPTSASRSKYANANAELQVRLIQDQGQTSPSLFDPLRAKVRLQAHISLLLCKIHHDLHIVPWCIPGMFGIEPRTKNRRQNGPLVLLPVIFNRELAPRQSRSIWNSSDSGKGVAPITAVVEEYASLCVV